VALDPRPIKRRPDVANKPSKVRPGSAQRLDQALFLSVPCSTRGDTSVLSLATQALSPEVIVIDDDDDDDVNVPAVSAGAAVGIQRSSASNTSAAGLVQLAAAGQLPVPAPHALLVAAKPALSHAARNPLPTESAPQPSSVSTCSTLQCAPTGAAVHGPGLGVCASVASSCGGAPAAGAAGAGAQASSGGSAEVSAAAPVPLPLPVRGGVRYDDPTLDVYVNDMYSYYAQREVRTVERSAVHECSACRMCAVRSGSSRARAL
jgi:hypothetical protein